VSWRPQPGQSSRLYPTARARVRTRARRIARGGTRRGIRHPTGPTLRHQRESTHPGWRCHRESTRRNTNLGVIHPAAGTFHPSFLPHENLHHLSHASHLHLSHESTPPPVPSRLCPGGRRIHESPVDPESRVGRASDPRFPLSPPPTATDRTTAGLGSLRLKTAVQLDPKTSVAPSCGSRPTMSTCSPSL
jgi:hypothetical protein